MNNCPFCHNHLDSDETQVSCPVCKRGYHPACWLANGYKCAVLGCPGNREGIVVAPLTVAPSAVAAETIAILPMTTNMIKTRSGLVDCPHCHGETVCKVTDNSSCGKCLLATGVVTGGQIVLCSVCKGKGQVNIPPNLTTCPHCLGTTLCTHATSNRGHCLHCTPSRMGGYYKDTKEYVVVGGLEKAAVMCSICKGKGQIKLPANAQICRHCGGKTICRRGIGGQTPCNSCQAKALTKTKLTLQGAQLVMCSICGGRGYLGK